VTESRHKRVCSPLCDRLSGMLNPVSSALTSASPARSAKPAQVDHAVQGSALAGLVAAGLSGVGPKRKEIGDALAASYDPQSRLTAGRKKGKFKLKFNSRAKPPAMLGRMAKAML